MDSLQPAPDPGNQRQKMAEIVEKETLLGGQRYSSFVDERSLQSRSFHANRKVSIACAAPATRIHDMWNIPRFLDHGRIQARLPALGVGL